MNIEKFFNRAKLISQQSDCKIKIGATLVYKNKVVASGYNTNKSNPLQKKLNIYRTANDRVFDVNQHCNGLHAEIMCLQHATKRFKGRFDKCSLFVYRENKNGNMELLARPCKACESYIKMLGIKDIYYTTKKGYNYERNN